MVVLGKLREIISCGSSLKFSCQQVSVWPCCSFFNTETNFLTVPDVREKPSTSGTS